MNETQNTLTFAIQPYAELTRTAEEQVAGHLLKVYLAPDKLQRNPLRQGLSSSFSRL